VPPCVVGVTTVDCALCRQLNKRTLLLLLVILGLGVVVVVVVVIELLMDVIELFVDENN